MKRALAAAFAAGAAAMALEMLASRWLAPGFGSTTATWSLLISATLLAGALGAALAATSCSRLSPAVPLVAAAIALLASGCGARACIEALLPLPLLPGAALAAAILVGPTCLALGMVLPLLAERSGAHGARGLGALVAASTAGSLAGTLLTALLLAPWLGLFASSGCVAAMLAVSALLVAVRRTEKISAALAIPLACSAACVDPISPSTIDVRLSPYGWIEVAAAGGAEVLRVDGIAQGAFSPWAPPATAWLERGQWTALLPYLHPRGKSALQVGLGAGEAMLALSAHGIEVETVEIDPLVIELSRARFGARLSIHLGDGRAFWRRTHERYDFAVLDAFQGESAPAHLLSVEAWREVQGLLRGGGIALLHWIGEQDGEASGAIWRTFGEVFAQRLALRTPREDGLCDLFFLGSSAPLAIPPHPDFSGNAALEAAAFVPPPGGALLTDEKNPLEALQAASARKLRRANLAAR